MLRFLPFLALAILLMSSCNQGEPTTASVSIEPITSEKIDLKVKLLAKELKQELLAALAEDKPAAAIGVCRDKAPAVTAAHSERTGWTIRRTALRLRNLENAPDSWERQQLKMFAEQIAEGGDPATLTSFETFDDHARFARAIPTGAECLLCHGPAVDAETTAALGKLYPEDEATGFQLGDLRGIFSVKVPLE